MNARWQSRILAMSVPPKVWCVVTTNGNIVETCLRKKDALAWVDTFGLGRVCGPYYLKATN